MVIATTSVQAAPATDTVYYYATTVDNNTTGTMTLKGGVSVPYQANTYTGDKTWSTNQSLGDASDSDEMVIWRINGNLTVNSAAIITAAARKRGMIIYATGNMTFNSATCNMTAKGATSIAGTSLPITDGYTLTNTTLGGIGGLAVNGTGVPQAIPTTAYTQRRGSIFGGGSGTGGATAWQTGAPNWSTGDTTPGINSGPGGNGGDSIGGAGNIYGGGGGAGNPGGTGKDGSGAFDGTNGTTGTGGLLILICDGTMSFTTTTLESTGSKAGNGNATAAAGGGGSGGGNIVCIASAFTGTPTVNILGGAGGTGYSAGTAGESGLFYMEEFTPYATTIGSYDTTTTGTTLVGSAYLGENGAGTCSFEYKIDDGGTADYTGATTSATQSLTSSERYIQAITGCTTGNKYKFRAKVTVNGVDYYGSNKYFYATSVDSTKPSIPLNASWSKVIYPDGASTATSWSASVGTAFSCIDEDWKQGNDADYIYTSTDANKSNFTMDNYTAGTAIDHIEITVRALRSSSYDNVVLYLTIGATDYEQGNLLSSSYTNFYDTTKSLYTDPSDGLAWTTADISGLIIGVKKTGVASSCMVSMIYVRVFPTTINSASTLTKDANYILLDMSTFSSLGYSSANNLNSNDVDTYSEPMAPGTVYTPVVLNSIATGQTLISTINLGTSPNKSEFILPGLTASYADRALYEPTTDTLDVQWAGWLDPTTVGYIVQKASSYDLTVSASGIVTARVYITSAFSTSDVSVTTAGFHSYRLYRSGTQLQFYRDGLLMGIRPIAVTTLDNNANALTWNQTGTVKWCTEGTMSIAGLECFDINQSAILTGSSISSTITLPNTMTTGTLTVDNATTTTINDAILTENITDFWKDCTITFTSGVLSGTTTTVTGFNIAADNLTFSALPSAPASGDNYTLTAPGIPGTITISRITSKNFEMWTDAMVVNTSYIPSSTTSTGNMNTFVTKPGAIPYLFATGTGVATGPAMEGAIAIPALPELPFQTEMQTAATALDVSVQWLWIIIMMTMCVAAFLMVFMTNGSFFISFAVLCFCCFFFSFTGVFPAWIGLIAAIMGIGSIFAVRSGF
jgi:hypothetical protein